MRKSMVYSQEDMDETMYREWVQATVSKRRRRKRSDSTSTPIGGHSLHREPKKSSDSKP